MSVKVWKVPVCVRGEGMVVCDECEGVGGEG